MPVLTDNPAVARPDTTAPVRRFQLPLVWRKPLAVLVLLLAVILVAYWKSAWGMVTIWARSDTYAHGFVVPFIALWLVWRQRAVLATLLPRPGPLAWLLMAGAAGLWLAGELVAVNAATQWALTMLIVLSVPAVLGWQVARALTFPLLFLFFAVPMGDFLLPRLMEWTADFTVLALRASGIPVYREGLQFVIPSGTWSVVEACSGIRYLIASVMVGCLFAYLSYQSPRKRWLFMGVAVLVPVVANWVRAYLIVLLGHVSGNTLATGVDHLIYGWVFFGVVMGLMFLLGARWTDPVPGPASAAAAAAGAAVSTGRGIQNKGQNGLKPNVIKRCLLLFFIVMAPHGVLAVMDRGVQTQRVQLAAPTVQRPWRATPAPPSRWTPLFLHASAQLDAGQTDADQQAVGLHLSYYRQQQGERKLVSSENKLVSSKNTDWLRLSAGVAPARLQGQPLQVEQALLRQRSPVPGAQAQHLLVWRFYWVNGHFTASEVVGKLQGAWGRLTGRGDDGANIVLYTPLRSADEPLADAATRLQAYLDSQGEALVAALIKTRGQD
ncbi:exosortase A [Simplicispira psychrophila]|uniref:exosortase A n=1 Tax=Simplicispira psychrophila TaxID=80882 RepID=UPI0004818FD9|nr:exosortase A [Simplicispira psychrophila]